MVPTEDEEGLEEKGYSFTIKNTCNTIATYEVNLEDLLASQNVKQFPNQYIKVSLNDGTPKVLNTYEEAKTTLDTATSSFKLTSGSLRPNEEATYELKLWMDANTPAIDEVMNATFESKITVNTSYIEEENLANEIILLATSQNDDYSKDKEVFKIDITSTSKNIIEYSYDNKKWTSVTPSKTLTLEKEYIKEGNYPIYVKDEVGNIKEYDIKTDKLDQTSPERIIEEINNQESYLLKITMTDEKSGVSSYQITESKETPTSWLDYTGIIEKEISENGVYYIWSKDKVGNISYEAYSITLIDKEAPKITVTNTLTDWGVKDILNIHLTDDVIGLSGYQVTTSEEEPTSFITIENTLDTTVTYEVSENGTYYIYAKDAYNHISHEKIVIDKIDDISPKITSITNSSNGNWTNQNVTITLLATDDELGIAKYQVKHSGTNNTWVDLSSNSDTWYNERNETVYYRAIDNAGNVSEEVSTDIKIDKTSPTFQTVSNSSSGNWTNQNVTITLSSTDAASGILKYQVKHSGTNNSWVDLSTNSDTWYNERNETVYYRVIDNAGNISEEASTNIKIDKTAPTQSFSIASSTSGSNGWYKALSIKLSVSDAHSGISGSKYCITTGSSCTPSTSATLSSNAYTVTLGTNGSAQKVCVNTTDKVGNVSSTTCSSAYSVDTTNPTAKISASVSGSSITVSASGSTDSGSGIVTYYYSKDGGSNFVSSSSSSYTFTGLANATYTLVVKVADKSGRVSGTVSTKATVNVGTIATTLVTNLVGKGQVIADDPDGNARYYGASPNNYVSFNGELWRIIGSFKNIDNGSGTKETRLKIIRNSSYGTLQWHTSATSNWSSTTLKTTLNTTFYNTLNTTSKNMISNALWTLGRDSTYSEDVIGHYKLERTTTQVSDGYPMTWTGIVGLMYVSDYGYATSGGSSGRTRCISFSKNNWRTAYTTCAPNDWLYYGSAEWTLSLGTNYKTTNVVMVNNNWGGVSAVNTNVVRPVVYLKTNVRITSGSGTSSSPYQLSL